LVFEGGRAGSTAAIRQAVKQSGFTTNRIVPPRASSKKKRDTKLSPEEKRLLSKPQEEFRNRQYQAALAGAQSAAEKLPQSSEIQQFLSLANFATGRYEAAQDVAQQALRLGKPWKWKQLKSHYSASKEYTEQLRNFEQYLHEEQRVEEFGALLGYHYWMLGHLKVAEKEFTKASQQAPDDELFSQLLEQIRKAANRSTQTKDSR